MSGLDGSDLKKMRAQTHDKYSYPNSTNQLGHSSQKMGSHISPIEDQEITSYGNHSEVSH